VVTVDQDLFLLEEKLMFLLEDLTVEMVAVVVI
jgi:hypothetical protein